MIEQQTDEEDRYMMVDGDEETNDEETSGT